MEEGTKYTVEEFIAELKKLNPKMRVVVRSYGVGDEKYYTDPRVGPLTMLKLKKKKESPFPYLHRLSKNRVCTEEDLDDMPWLTRDYDVDEKVMVIRIKGGLEVEL